MTRFRLSVAAAALAALFVLVGGARADHNSSKFEGAKANTGYAMHASKDGRIVLTLSDDFKIPDTPAPHWQIVDSRGNVYLLNQLKIKGGKTNRSITLPSYISDVAKVQIWCSWAETLLGEASFTPAAK